jgi:hypothetical protein
VSLPRLDPIPRAAIGAALMALDQSSREEALEALEDDELAREVRRLEREGGGRSNGHRLRCGGCQRWLAAANQACGCGFHNDIAGRRNRGGYR